MEPRERRSAPLVSREVLAPTDRLRTASEGRYSHNKPVTLYRFQSRALRGEFLAIRADDIDHALALMRRQGHDPRQWRPSSPLTDLPPRR